MGVVYLAEQRDPVFRRVAIKLIRSDKADDFYRKRFEAERQALALMNHPNVASILESGVTDDGQPYFAMEYVRGEPITKFCDRARMTVAARLELFIAVCSGVQHAHNKGIVHRDLKPANILVTEQAGEPIPKIIDFGVAKALDRPLIDETSYTEIGQLLGTPAYMSPEQAASDAAKLDTRTDIYSLGVVLYELLVGGLPFTARDLRQAGYLEMQRIICEAQPPKPSTRLETSATDSNDIAGERATNKSNLNRALRGDLDWVALKALEKDRGDSVLLGLLDPGFGDRVDAILVGHQR